MPDAMPPVLLFRCCDESTRHADARFYRQRHSPALTFRADAATKSGQQVGRGCPAPRGLALPGRSPWQGRRFARPLHPTRATSCHVASTIRSALLPRYPQRQAFAPDTTTKPCAGWMPATSCHVASTIKRALLPRYPQRQAFAPDTTTKPCAGWMPATSCHVASTIRRALLPRYPSVRLSRPTPRRKTFRLSTPDQARAAWIGASVRRWTRPGGAGAR